MTNQILSPRGLSLLVTALVILPATAALYPNPEPIQEPYKAHAEDIYPLDGDCVAPWMSDAQYFTCYNQVYPTPDFPSSWFDADMDISNGPILGGSINWIYFAEPMPPAGVPAAPPTPYGPFTSADIYYVIDVTSKDLHWDADSRDPSKALFARGELKVEPEDTALYSPLVSGEPIDIDGQVMARYSAYEAVTTRGGEFVDVPHDPFMELAFNQELVKASYVACCRLEDKLNPDDEFPGQDTNQVFYLSAATRVSQYYAYQSKYNSLYTGVQTCDKDQACQVDLVNDQGQTDVTARSHDYTYTDGLYSEWFDTTNAWVDNPSTADPVADYKLTWDQPGVVLSNGPADPSYYAFMATLKGDNLPNGRDSGWGTITYLSEETVVAPT